MKKKSVVQLPAIFIPSEPNIGLVNCHTFSEEE